MDKQKRLGRFFSEQHHKVGYSHEETTRPLPKNNFLRQISIQAEHKIDQLEQEAQIVDEILQQPTFTRLTSVSKDEPIHPHTSIIIEPVSSHTVIETGVPPRQLKTGSQRLRWNLLFNLLFWLLVPLPLWLPFVSNSTAVYLLPVIQCLFVTMWTSEHTPLILSFVAETISSLFSYRLVSDQESVDLARQSIA